MNLSVETIRRLWASARNYASLLIGFASGVGVVSASQQKGLTDALGEIYQGVSLIVHGSTSAWAIITVVAAPIVGPLLARLASKSATTESQAKAIAAAVDDPKTPISPAAKDAIQTAAQKVLLQPTGG